MFVSLLQAFLLNEDLGDSLDSVEALLKKHEDFEKSLSAQEEKITVRHWHWSSLNGQEVKQGHLLTGEETLLEDGRRWGLLCRMILYSVGCISSK